MEPRGRVLEEEPCVSLVLKDAEIPFHLRCALQAASADAVISTLAGELVSKGHTKASFEKAALARERRSPTGLPFPTFAVAIPHAEPEHVLSPAILVAALAAPIKFREMGSPANAVEAHLVVMPALSAKEQAAGALSELIALLQDDALRRALAEAPTAVVMGEVIRDRLGLARA
jgi:PTS system galactitol-specific IIA component